MSVNTVRFPAVLALLVLTCCVNVECLAGNTFDILDFGAVTDGKTVNTATILDGKAAHLRESGPIGFAAAPALGLETTTGGVGGKTVIVTTGAELNELLAKRKQDRKRGETPPLVILIKGTLTNDEVMMRVEDESNLTITGGKAGARLKGFGLFIKRSSNIIVKNLNFVDCPSDALNCGWTKTHHVWIDHCSFTDDPPGGKGGGKNDGMLDISGGASYITVSWCHFKNHRKTCLLGHSDKNGEEDRGRLKTTYHHNWFDGTYSRHPRVRFAECHVFNNYYVGNEYGVASTMEADVVVEGNYFEKVLSPTHAGYSNSAPGDLVERNNLYRDCENAPETRGDAFDPRRYYSYALADPKDVPSIVSAGAGAPGNR